MPAAPLQENHVKICRWIERQGTDAWNYRLVEAFGAGAPGIAKLLMKKGCLVRVDARSSGRTFRYELTDLGRRVACGEAVPAPAGATGLPEGAAT